MNSSLELNLDSIIGPTHNYAGLAVGNLASRKHVNQPSNPRQAALQGLAKMKFMLDLGIPQAVLPPHPRPDFSALHRLGFSGSDSQIIEQAAKDSPTILAACYSASAMWAANAATVSPSADTLDGRVHFTPANLHTQFHRSLETAMTAKILRRVFPNPAFFAHHDPLPSVPQFADEGAANHIRLGPSHDDLGVEIFTYGRVSDSEWSRFLGPKKFPARQAIESCRAIARIHNLISTSTLFFWQNPRAIDAGAFHTDVVAVGNLNVLLYHEAAFSNSTDAMNRIQLCLNQSCDLCLIKVLDEIVPLSEAISSYLFNSQIVSLPDSTMALIAPTESAENTTIRQFLDTLLLCKTPIKQVHYVDVRQSMNNGGGPACLRLRVPLTRAEFATVHPGVILDNVLYAKLTDWINRHYRDQLKPEDLSDPKLPGEVQAALDELTAILQLPELYPFQIKD